MSGYVPFDADEWAETAEALTAYGKPWTDGAAACDLKWHVDQQAGRLLKRGNATPSHAALVDGIPSPAALAARWHWTRHRCRMLLADPSRWWDVYRWGPQSIGQLARPSRPPSPAARPPSPAARPSDNGDTPTVAEDSPAVARGSPAAVQESLHARSSHPDPDPDRSDPPQPPASGGSDPGPPQDGPTHRAQWLRDRGLQLLELDLVAGHPLEPAIQAWETGQTAYVEAILRHCRPTRGRPGHPRRPADWRDAPTGIRARDVAEGLRLAAAAWRASGRPMVQPRAPELDEPWTPPEEPELDERPAPEAPAQQARPPPEPAPPLSPATVAHLEQVRRRLDARKPQRTT